MHYYSYQHLLTFYYGELSWIQLTYINYQINPSRYQHWKLSVDGSIATLTADFNENGGLRPGYKLKLNSYDLGVDIELNDVVNRFVLNTLT
jgi:benzoyl-CoA-dihydrodiol lyase